MSACAVSRWIFCTLANGRAVEAAKLSSPGGLEVEVLAYGATVRRLRAPSPAGPIDVLPFYPRLSDYEADEAYLNATVGRCANRIAGGRFMLDGLRHQVSVNEGANCLHGGACGLNSALWTLETPDLHRPSVTLTYISPDGESGFSGKLRVKTHYALPAPDTLRIVYEATVTQPGPVNLTQHLYFNLSGEPRSTILDHTLSIAGRAITPVGGDLIPTGALMDVAGTPFDLRRPQAIGEAMAQPHPQLAIPGGFDHNWALENGRGPAARLNCPRSKLTLELFTNQPGLQVYAGQAMPEPFGKNAAIALEPQGFPDAVNQPSFPNIILRPGEVYRHQSDYRLC